MAEHFSMIFMNCMVSWRTGLASMLKQIATVIGYTSWLSARFIAFSRKGSNSSICLLFAGTSNMWAMDRMRRSSASIFIVSFSNSQHLFTRNSP